MESPLYLYELLKVPTTTVSIEIKQVNKILVEQLPSIALIEPSFGLPMEKGITNITLRIFVDLHIIQHAQFTVVYTRL